MRRKLLFVALISAVVLFSEAARSDDGFYIIPIPAGVGTRISSVPYTISSPGFYYLGGNLSYGGSESAITVNTDDVTIELMGYTLTSTGEGSWRRGVYMHGRKNVEIRNGTINHFSVGIYEEQQTGKGHRVVNVRFIGNYMGVLLSGTNHMLAGCTALDNISDGFYVEQGIISGCSARGGGNRCIDISNGLIKNCYAVSCRIGFQILSGSAIGNVAIDNTDYGFLLGSSELLPLLMDQNSAISAGSANYFGGTALTVWGTNAGR